MIAVSLNVGGGVRLIKPAKLYICTQTHYKHNEDGRTAPGVCGNGSVPLSHSGNVVTRIGTHTHTHWFVWVKRTHGAPYRGYAYVPLRFGENGGDGRVVQRCWVNFQCRGVLLIWIIVGQGPIALAIGAGGGCLDNFSLIYHFSFLSPSPWVTARYRLKYCLKGPLNPEQPTNQNRGERR